MEKKYNFSINKIQSNNAILLCLKNAEDFINDVKLFLTNKKYSHIPIHLVFALEEIGKAKIILDKQVIGGNLFVLSTGDGIYDHQKKINVAVNELDLPENEKLD